MKRIGLSLLRRGGPVLSLLALLIDPLASRSIESAPLAWRTVSPMPTPRVDHGVAQVNGKVYVIGGYSGSTLSTVEEYDPATDTWTTKAPMPTPRRFLVVTAANGKIYAIGGVNFTDPNNVTYSFATEEYDPVSNTWATKANFPLGPPFNNVLGNVFIGGASANGKVYVVVFNAGTSPATYEYDPVQNVWNTNKAPVPFVQTRYSVASLNNKIYVAQTDHWFAIPSGPLAEYDPLADSWTIKSSSSNRRRYALTATSDKLYAIGGIDSAGPVPNFNLAVLGTVEEFDPAANSWSVSSPIRTARHSPGLATVNGRIYVIGGGDTNTVPLSVAEASGPPAMLDYDGDGRADMAVYRRSTGQWLVRRSTDAGLTLVGWGAPTLGDTPVPADYDGDGKTDIAVYRAASTGEWFVRRSTDAGLTLVAWGAPTLADIPAPADYDGDRKTDVAVYRRSTGEWFIRRSTDGSLVLLAWGAPALGDTPVPADYDGDGGADIAVYRTVTGEWFVRRSADASLILVAWGAPALGDAPVPADYDGDGKTDIAVYRTATGEWFIRRSTDAGLTLLAWGAPTLADTPVPADYDGDGKTDIAVYRRSTGQWFIRRSTDLGLTQLAWGSPFLDDVPARP